MRNKINTKEELMKILKKYKGILNNSTIDYLYSLINLEFSVIKECISENDRVALSDLELYRKIAIYNIYNRALKFFYEDSKEIIIRGNNDNIECLQAYLDYKDNQFNLYNFDYCDYINKDKIPKFYKSTYIGCITLFETVESVEKREAELNRIMDKLERLYSQKNPYSYEPGYIGGPRPQWEFNHSRKIKLYENMFNKLDSKKELTDEDKEEIIITRKYSELLLNDYGLTNDSFKEEKVSNYEIDRYEQSAMQKRLVKKMPGLTIVKKIKYI